MEMAAGSGEQFKLKAPTERTAALRPLKFSL